jgi:polysaccharide transporter, PST family
LKKPAISGRLIAVSSATLLVENVLRLAATAAISFWIARTLGPEDFGLLAFASALAAIFLGAAGLGLDVPTVLRLTADKDQGAVLATAIALRLGAALAAFVAAVVVAVVLNHDEPKTLAVTVIVALSILAYAPSVFDFWFKAHVQAAAPASMRLLSTLLSSGVKLMCLSLGGGVVALAWAVVFEAALSTLLLWLAWRRSARSACADPMRPNQLLARGMLRESWPYLTSNIATVIYMKVDVVLLGHLSSHAQTGVYSVVQKLSEVLYIVPIALVESAFPALARRRRESGGDPAQDGQLLFDLSVAASTLAAVVGVLLAGPLIHLVFGPQYAQAVPLFHLHAWTCLAVALNAARHRWLATTGLQSYAPVVTILGAVINVALNVTMIPLWGAQGAVYAALCAYFASGFLTSFVFRALRPIGWMQARALWPWTRLYRLGFAKTRPPQPPT